MRYKRIDDATLRYQWANHVTIVPTASTVAIPNGIITFHEICMSWSTRRRGSVQRIQIWIITKKIALLINHTNPMTGPPSTSPKGEAQPPRNKTEPIALTANMFAYSAKKKSANFIAEYSV